VFGIPPVLREEMIRLAKTKINESKANSDPYKVPIIGIMPVATKSMIATTVPSIEPNALCNDF
jgi:hypothetical protein